MSTFASSDLPASGHGGWAWRRWWSCPHTSCPGSSFISCHLLWAAVDCNPHAFPTRGDAANASSSPRWVNKGLPVWYSKADMVNVWRGHVWSGKWNNNSSSNNDSNDNHHHNNRFLSNISNGCVQQCFSYLSKEVKWKKEYQNSAHSWKAFHICMCFLNHNTW